MLGDVGWPELIFILAIVLLVFGVGRIRKLGGELGGGIRAFKESLQGDEKPKKMEDTQENTIEVSQNTELQEIKQLNK